MSWLTFWIFRRESLSPAEVAVVSVLYWPLRGVLVSWLRQSESHWPVPDMEPLLGLLIGGIQ